MPVPKVVAQSHSRRVPPRLAVSPAIAAALLLALGAAAQLRTGPAQPPVAPQNWEEFLPAEAMKARTFLRQNPQLDGRSQGGAANLVVAVLDTGVDPLAQGLQRTSDGKAKVIEARDFSGQGDVTLQAATAVGEGPERAVLLPGGRRALLAGLKPAVDGQWWTGVFRERAIGPEALRDLNLDGKKDGELTVLAWRTGTGANDALLAIDWDGDGDLAEEPAVRPYHVAQELLVAPQPRPGQQHTQLSLAFEPAWGTQQAQLHFTDGSHGTHVAGIIAGYQMFGREGWDGVAPGAQVLSLKIGHNARSGGATPTGSFAKALRFCGEYSRQRGVPVVVNASYGIAAGTESKADLDREVDQLVQEFPLLTIAFSAGNEGPGLSSIGSPAAADLALAVGAALPKEAAAALYGGKLEQTELFSFSSRGGELAKPELVAPGAASASVPVWDGHEIKQGTSMAAPQAAGAMLLVWAALLADLQPGQRAQLGAANRVLPLHSGVVRAALQHSAKPLAGYSRLEQGAGMIDVPAAAALAKRLIKQGSVKALGYAQASHAPRGDGESMPATWLRAGWAGKEPAVVSADVKALLPQTWSGDQRAQFAQVLDLKSDTPWLEVLRPRLQLRGERESSFELRIAAEKLKQPGVYVGVIAAREPGAAADELAFVHQVAVVVPEQTSAADGHRKRWEGLRLAPGRVWRMPIAVPAGAQQASVRLTRRSGQFAQVALAVYDPEGSRQRPPKRWASSRDGSDAEWIASGDDLSAGVWEVTASAWLVPGDASSFDAEVRFSTVQVKGKLELAAESGGPAQAKVTLTQQAAQVLAGSARGQIDAWERSQELKVEGDKLSHPVVLGPLTSGAELQLTLDRRLYDTCTDVAVAVRDAQGEAVAETAFGSPRAELRWKHKGGEARYTLEVSAGFAKPRKEPWKINVRERLMLAKPVPLQVKAQGQQPGQLPGTARILLYPYQASRWTVSTAEILPMPPKGFRLSGRVELSDDDSSPLLTLPVRSAE